MTNIRSKFKENKTTIMLCFFAFIVAFFFSSGQISDYDYWFHYRAGEHFFNTGQVPQVPIGSWYGMENGMEWISHEWLFGCFIYIVEQIFGEIGVYLFVPISMGLILSLTVFLFKDYFKKNILLSIIGLILTAMIMGMGSAPRPQIFAYLLTVLLFYVISKDSENDCKILYLLPLLTIFWVNVHGGSYILVFIALLVDIFIHLFDFKLGNIVFEKQSRNRLNRRLMIFLICIGAIFINGHGVKMILYPFTNISDSFMQELIIEWFSPDLKIVSHYKIYVIAILGACALISSKKEIKSLDMCFFFLFVLLTARSVRFGPQLALVGLPIMLQYSDALDFTKFGNRQLNDVLVVSLTTLFVIFSIVVSVKTLPEPFDYSNMPSDKILDKVREVEPEHLYNGYNEGGYLVYKGIDVFVDGRADIYSAYNLRDWNKITNLTGNIHKLLDKYDFDYFLIREQTPLYTNYLSLHSEFEEIMVDGDYHLIKTIGSDHYEK